ncbi:MAG: transglycosylase domain-containing protein [Proteobacteria bacterium]|uniref:Transglycosylase domain-containing protein n=1 Tax=Candidatus Enterousia avistercoris TaxID=2840788 RepID=A0A9D9DEP7_9PROT|nr:transglycosylase domain-containing protein [Candidatus Enterousia avistercoris]
MAQRTTNGNLRRNKDQRARPSWGLRIFVWCVDLFMLALVGVAIYVVVIFLQMPSLDAILHETRPAAVIFMDANGDEIRASNRIMGAPVSVETLPPHVWQAIVAIEDKRFFEHGPIDIRGIARAMVSNLIHGRLAAGGSSITQQTAKNIFLSREKKISRKVQELILSYWLENRFTKNQVLDLYMNRVSLVGGMRGIDAAARVMFQTSANNLSIAQAAQIAAMLKAPTTYSPLANPDKNIARARIILQEMVRQGYITLNQARVAARALAPATPAQNTNIYRYWTDFVLEEVKSTIGTFDSDMYVYTTLDMKLQDKIADILPARVEPYQGAVVAMTTDGAVRAMVGGTDYQASQFNRALALRQPGSSFKPVVYLVALENGMMPESYVNDSPFAIGDYSPQNYNKRYYGDITLATAFAKSVNSVPLKLTETYGIDSVLDMAARLGVGNKLRREYSTVLGASEISLLDLTKIYAVIWNNGQSVRPYTITKITDPYGNIIYERNPSEPMQILMPQTVDYMTQLLADVVAPGGTGHRAAAPGVLGGKTGTSNNNRDAWFVGAWRDLIIGVWMGNDDFTPMSSKITGGTIPATIFHDIVK